MVLIVGAAIAYFAWRDELSLERLAEREAQLRGWVAEAPVMAYSLAFGLYFAVTALSIPAATGMSLAYAWLLGFWPAVVLLSFASTAGATAAFLLARYLLREVVTARFGPRLAVVQDALNRDGAFYLFLLRLTPVIPFVVVNVVLGLTTMRARTFWWVSQLGMLPATCVFASAGASIPTAAALVEQGAAAALRWQTALAFLLLGLFPLVARLFVRRWRRRREILAAANPEARFPVHRE